MPEKNKYYQLIKDLQSGDMTLMLVSMAIRQHVAQNEKIPEGVRNLLTQAEGGGYIAAQFKVMQDVIGKLELAYRRGKQEAIDEDWHP